MMARWKISLLSTLNLIFSNPSDTNIIKVKTNAYCFQEPCTQESVFQIVDEKGKVVETANNSEGIYSSLQGIPPIPPSVERTTIYEDTSTYKIIIKCPG